MISIGKSHIIQSTILHHVGSFNPFFLSSVTTKKYKFSINIPMISYYLNAHLELFLLMIRWSNPQCFIVKSSIVQYLFTISHDQIMIKSIQFHSSSAFFSISHAFFSIFPCVCSIFFTKISHPWSSLWQGLGGPAGGIGLDAHPAGGLSLSNGPMGNHGS